MRTQQEIERKLEWYKDRIEANGKYDSPQMLDACVMTLEWVLQEVQADMLPQDILVTSISGNVCKLSEADRDQRFGMLAYGIIAKDPCWFRCMLVKIKQLFKRGVG